MIHETPQPSDPPAKEDGWDKWQERIENMSDEERQAILDENEPKIDE